MFDKPGGTIKAPVTEQPVSTMNPAPTSPGSQNTQAQPTVYTVKNGNSLSKIAQQKYGDSTKWRKIFEAN